MDDELKMRELSKKIEVLAQEISIHGREDLKNAVQILRKIREQREKIVEYWKNAKKSAFTAYKEIVAREKEMLQICDEAENCLYGEILGYVEMQKSVARKIQRDAEKSREKDVEKLLAESEKFRLCGDEKTSEIKRQQAEKIRNLPILSEKIFCPEDGFSFRKTWHARITDEHMVPSYFEGHEVRSIDMKKLLEVRRENPKAKIPGIEFYQSESLVLKNAERT